MIDFLETELAKIAHLSTEEIAKNENFWINVQKAYLVTNDFINLENGYYNVMPQATLEAQIRHTRNLNLYNTFFMRTEKDKIITTLKVELAQLISCKPDNIAFARNATDALNIFINGICLEKGDEIIACQQDYPTALEAIEQRVRRDGIVKKIINLPIIPHSKEEIVACYEKAITPQTKLLLVTHIIHWTGQILPVKEICEMAHRYGVEVLVDSAHAFGQIELSFEEINCDYWLANLHKWLAAPISLGVLAIKSEKIAKVTPLIANVSLPKNAIEKLENTSALPMPIFLTVFDAIHFHQIFGTKLKEARLHYLKNYWLEQTKNLSNVEVFTSVENSCAIASFNILNKKAIDVAKELFETHNIFTVGFDLPFLSIVRVTPNFYNSIQDLDALILAIKKMANASNQNN